MRNTELQNSISRGCDGTATLDGVSASTLFLKRPVRTTRPLLVRIGEVRVLSF